MAKASEILFRIFYSTSFTIIFIVLIAFICVSPADTLYESYKRRRIIDIFLIAGVYVVTGLIAILIYASRLFTNRSILKDIPKTYMPIERNDLPTTRTWRFVSDMLVRSAVIAYQAKPRSKRVEYESSTASARIAKLVNPESGKTQEDHQCNSDWGLIHHPGWSSPAASDLPNLQYETVVAELTDLVEAKAVSLVPIDPLCTPAPDGLPSPNPRVIEALTRADDTGMRKYLMQLKELEVVADNEVTTAFITSYERARFAPEPLTETNFQSLMRMFAELLRSIKPVNPELIDLDALSEDEEDDDRNGNNDESHLPKIYTDLPTKRHPLARSRSTISTIDSNNSVIHLPPSRISEDSAPSLATDEEHETRQSPLSVRDQARRPSSIISAAASGRSSPSPSTNMNTTRNLDTNTRHLPRIAKSKPKPKSTTSRQQIKSLPISTSDPHLPPSIQSNNNVSPNQNRNQSTASLSSTHSIPHPRRSLNLARPLRSNRSNTSLYSNRGSRTGSVIVRLNDEHNHHRDDGDGSEDVGGDGSGSGRGSRGDGNLRSSALSLPYTIEIVPLNVRVRDE